MKPKKKKMMGGGMVKYQKGGMQSSPGTVNTMATSSFPSKDSVVNRKPMTKNGIMTYNIGGMVKSQVDNLKNKTIQESHVARSSNGSMTRAKSKVNAAGNYTKPTMRKSLVTSVKAGGKGGKPGQWSARKAQMVAKQYKAKGGGYTS